MEHLDALVIDVDVVQIVELLQHEVAGIIEQIGAGMVFHPLEEHLVGDAIMQVFTRMDFVAEIDPVLVKGIQDRQPAARQLVKCFLHQTRRTLRERVEEGPGERAGESRVLGQPEVVRGLGGPLQLLHGPFLSRLGVAMHRCGGKTVQHGVVNRMRRD